MPCAAHRVAERVYAPERIVMRRVAVREDDPACSKRRRERSLANHSRADRARRAVPRAADDDAIGCETERLRRARRQTTRYVFRFVDASE